MKKNELFKEVPTAKKILQKVKKSSVASVTLKEEIREYEFQEVFQ